MSNIIENYIEEYIRKVLPEKDEILMDIEKYAEKNNIPIIQPEVAQLIRVLIKLKKVNKILEIGTAIGYSAIIMANAMGDNGEIVTIERRDEMIDLAKKNIEKFGYQDRITIIKGDAEEILPRINEKFDFVFLDAAKGKYMEFFPYCIKNLVEGGVIVSDNVLFKGMVANDNLVIRRKKTIVKRMRSYLDYILNNPAFESCIIPIGDGITITYKK